MQLRKCLSTNSVIGTRICRTHNFVFVRRPLADDAAMLVTVKFSCLLMTIAKTLKYTRQYTCCIDIVESDLKEELDLRFSSYYYWQIAFRFICWPKLVHKPSPSKTMFNCSELTGLHSIHAVDLMSLSYETQIIIQYKNVEIFLQVFHPLTGSPYKPAHMQHYRANEASTSVRLFS